VAGSHQNWASKLDVFAQPTFFSEQLRQNKDHFDSEEKAML
jgi:hypothetical protein